MICTQNYSTPINSKRPTNKGQTTPTTLRTSLDYSESSRAGTRTENLATDHPTRHQNNRSLFRKNFSLIRHPEFPVNSEAHLPKTNESSLLPVRFTHMEAN